MWSKVSSFVRPCHYDVIGLEPKKKYNFRVRAENQYGVSEPIELDSVITAKFPFTVPDAPGHPQVLEWDEIKATLIWERPVHDGGAKIQGYKIEFKDISEGGTWRTANDYVVKEPLYVIHNLLNEHDYEFRVLAKNAAGFSKPSIPTPTFRLKGKAKPPSKPGTPIVLKVGRTYADLKWEPPISDGGSKITGYSIEKRQVGNSVWVKCHDYSVFDCKFTAMNLVEGADYEFRVFALNIVGKSEPSQSTVPVKICEFEGGEKPEFIVPLTNKVVQFGKTITLRCEATGKPIPNAKWLKNGREIVSGGRYRCESANGVFQLHFPEVTELDDGDYTCESYNPVGFTTTSSRVKIGRKNLSCYFKILFLYII